MSNLPKGKQYQMLENNNDLQFYCERLNKENLKLQHRLKTMQNQIESFQMDSENQSILNNDTSIKQFRPDEFIQEWEVLGKNDIQEHFLDYFDNPYICYHLIQEMFSIIISIVNDEISNIYKNIMNILGIEYNQNNELYISKKIYSIFLDFYEQIFESNSRKDSLYNSFIQQYIQFYKNVFGNFQEKEFFDIFSNSSFKLLVIKIQKIYLFTKFRQPSLSFLFEDFNTRKIEIKRSLVAKVIVVQGKLPNQKNEEINCIHLISPPMQKNIPFYGLKPLVLELADNYNINSEKEKIKEYNSGVYHLSKKRVVTEYDEENKNNEHELVPELTLDNIGSKIVNYSPRLNIDKPLVNPVKGLNKKQISEIKPKIKKGINGIQTKRDNSIRLVYNQEKTSKEIKIIGAKLVKMSKIPELNSIKHQKIMIDKLKVDTVIPVTTVNKHSTNKRIENILLTERRPHCKINSKAKVIRYQFGS